MKCLTQENTTEMNSEGPKPESQNPVSNSIILALVSINSHVSLQNNGFEVPCRNTVLRNTLSKGKEGLRYG